MVARSLGLAVVVAVGVAFSVGCDRLTARNQSEPERFQLQRDSQGRMIRLDKVTGEVVIVDGTRLIPVKSPNAPSARGSARTAGAAKQAEHVPAAPVVPTANEPAATLPAQPALLTSIPAETLPHDYPPLPVGQMVMINEPAPVFVAAKQTRTPLQIMTTGSRVKLLGAEGDWYRIQFADARWGPRVGFVSKAFVSRAPSDAGQDPK
jgi:hypothetical protein